MQLVFDNAVHKAAAAGIEAHLKVLVVDADVMKAEFRVGKDGEPPRAAAVVAKGEIPDLHGVVHGDKERLRGMDAAVVAQVLYIAQAVAAGIPGQLPAHGLPGYAPVFAGVVIPDVEVMPRHIHRHAVGPEAGDAVMLRRAVEQISARGMVEHAVHVARSDIIGPGYGQVGSLNDVFAVRVVEISVLHGQASLRSKLLLCSVYML